MSLFGGGTGAECSAAANPLSQFTKLVHDEQPQYLERLRLGGEGAGGEAGSSGGAAAQGLRSEGGVVGEQDAIMESFLHASDGGLAAPLAPLPNSAAAAAAAAAADSAFSPSLFFDSPYAPEHMRQGDGDSTFVGHDVTVVQRRLNELHLNTSQPHEWATDFYRAPLEDERGGVGGLEENQPGMMALPTAKQRSSKAEATETTTATSTAPPAATAPSGGHMTLMASPGANLAMIAPPRRFLNGIAHYSYTPASELLLASSTAAPVFSDSLFLSQQSSQPSLFSVAPPRGSHASLQDPNVYQDPNAARQRPSAASTAPGKGKGRLVAEPDEDSWEAQFAQADAQIPTATATGAMARAALLRKAAQERSARQKQALEDPLTSLEAMEHLLSRQDDELMMADDVVSNEEAAAALREYQAQLMLVEQHNKRMEMAGDLTNNDHTAAAPSRTKVDSHTAHSNDATFARRQALHEYQVQLMLLEQHNKKRLLMARDFANKSHGAAARGQTRIDSIVNGETVLEDATMASTGYASGDLPLRTYSDPLEFSEDDGGVSNDDLERGAQQLSDPYVLEEDNPFREVDDPFRHGMQIMDEGGNLSVAALAFEAAVQRNPQHVDAWTMLGTAQAQNEKEAPAIRAWQRAVELDNGNLPALMGLAVAYTNEGYDSSAYATLERWLAAKYPSVVAAAAVDARLPSFPQLAQYTAEGKPRPQLLQQWQMGQELGSGARLFSNTSIFDPDNVAPRQSLRERVTDLFIRAAQLSPAGDGMDPDVQVGLGVLLFGAAEHDKAIDCFSAALASTVAGASNGRAQLHLLWNRLGATLANAGRSEEAIAAYERALALRPNFVRARYNLGVSCCNVGCLDAAAQHLLAALELHGGVVAQDSREQARRHIDGARADAAGMTSGASSSSPAAAAAAAAAVPAEINRPWPTSEWTGMSKRSTAAAAGEPAPDMAAAPQHNPSTALYETLRRVFVQMGRQDLAAKVGPGMDLDAFRAELDF